jgi:hypothetical protein
MPPVAKRRKRAESLVPDHRMATFRDIPGRPWPIRGQMRTPGSDSWRRFRRRWRSPLGLAIWRVQEWLTKRWGSFRPRGALTPASRPLRRQHGDKWGRSVALVPPMELPLVSPVVVPLGSEPHPSSGAAATATRTQASLRANQYPILIPVRSSVSRLAEPVTPRACLAQRWIPLSSLLAALLCGCSNGDDRGSPGSGGR